MGDISPRLEDFGFLVYCVISICRKVQNNKLEMNSDNKMLHFFLYFSSPIQRVNYEPYWKGVDFRE